VLVGERPTELKKFGGTSPELSVRTGYGKTGSEERRRGRKSLVWGGSGGGVPWG